MMKKNKAHEIKINSDWCKGCCICVAFCPKQVLELSRQEKAEVVNLQDCTACMMCELRCPDLAITVIKTTEEVDPNDDAANR